MFWKLICCSFFLVSIISCGNKTPDTKENKSPNGQAGSKSSQPLKVEGYIAKTSILNQSIDIAGSLLPFEETEIHPEVAGRVVSLSIKEGAYVSKGTVLAKLFDGDLQAQLHKDLVQLQMNQKNQQRQQQLLKIGGISQADYDVSVLNVSTVRADIEVMQANISKTIIRAPLSGKMGFKNISMGAYVTPSTVVTTIRQINKLKLEFSIPEKYTSLVTMGHFVTFKVEGAPRKYSAKVISTESSITENSRALKVRAEVDDVDKYVSAGMFANANFDLGDYDQAILVPTQSIIPGARDKKIIVSRNGTASFQTVTTGIRDSANVQIVTGLAVGDTVITTGILQLKPGNKIIVSSIKK